MSFCGISRSIAIMARKPVQCIGIRQSGLISFRACTVLAIISSGYGAKCHPPTTAFVKGPTQAGRSGAHRGFPALLPYGYKQAAVA
jgi:hypothetical protein